jgi:hypothetical protein
MENYAEWIAGDLTNSGTMERTSQRFKFGSLKLRKKKYYLAEV